MDYFKVSSNIFQSVSRFEVVDRSESVHFPLSCCLTFNLLEQSGIMREMIIPVKYIRSLCGGKI